MSGNSNQCRGARGHLQANLPLSPALHRGLCSHVWLPTTPDTQDLLLSFGWRTYLKVMVSPSGDFVFLGLSHALHVIQLLFIFLLLIHLLSI